MIKVRVSEQGGVFKELELEEGSTVMTALQKAGARTDVAKEVRINFEVADTDDIVANGDTIYVVPNVKGAK